jgi:predicted TIM-barrel fold metal-dependent hydrolase
MNSRRRLFDSHFHVIDHRFPLVANQGYTPPPFSLADYRTAASPLGVEGGAVVSGAFQAFDQSYLLAALGELGPGWVGVTQIAEDCPDAEIARLSQADVRAVRFNIVRGGAGDFDRLEALARRCHAVAGWHCELYVDASTLAAEVDRLAALPSVSIDHLGMTEAGLPVLLKLVEAGVHVKATGFGRVKLDVARALDAIAATDPAMLVFGTDMPSTRAPRPFAAADIDLVETVLGVELARRVFWDNAQALYRVTA